ncbi:MAG TPA: hypothetical protein VF581_00340 [Flavobacterium sp.]|jgi:hypothetical protein
MSQIFNRHNFHNRTFCIFSEVSAGNVQLQKPDYVSKHGSLYYFTSEGVTRISNHWGRAAKCKWRLLPMENQHISRTKAGFARWSDFKPDNDTEKLYYLSVDDELIKVDYLHKESLSGNNAAVLRTTSETVKRIREIRSILKSDDFRQGEKKFIVSEMINTSKPLREIRNQDPVKSEQE